MSYLFKKIPINDQPKNVIEVNLEHMHGDADLTTYSTVEMELTKTWQKDLSILLDRIKEAQLEIEGYNHNGNSTKVINDGYIEIPEINVDVEVHYDKIYGCGDDYASISVSDYYLYDENGIKHSLEKKTMKDKVEDF